MNVPFQDLVRLHDSIQAELDEAVSRIVSAAAFVGGAEVGRFEDEFAEAHGAVGAAACGSGTDALSLALRALDVGPGDEVVVPAMTFIATAEAVVHVGATPVIADVDPASLLLTANEVERVRTARTKAVIPVHLYGHTVSFAQISAWRADGLVVIEDSAQAHIAHEDGRFVGSAGHAACFSFYPGKNLGAWGDGGAVISQESAVVDRVRMLRDHGRTSKYLHDMIGWCSRLDGLQAAVLRVKLRHLADWTERRRLVAEQYRARLGDRLVAWGPGAVHHLLVLRTSGPDEREALSAHLRASGVATGVHYPIPLSQQPSMSHWSIPAPNADAAAQQVLSLPMDPLMSDSEVNTVCDRIEEFIG